MKKSLKTKFMLELLCASVIPVLILFYLNISNFQRFYDDRTRIIANSEMEKAAYQMNAAFQEVDDLTASLIYSRYDNKYCIQSIAGMETENSGITDMQRLTNYREFTYVCSNLIYNNKYVEAVYLFNDSGYTYSYTKTKEFYLEQGYKQSDWYQRMKEENLYQMITFWRSDNARVSGDYVLEIRPIADAGGNKTSYIVAVCNSQLLQKLESDSALDNEGMILDASGNVLYRIMGNMELPQSVIHQVEKADSGFINIQNGGYIYQTLEVNDWKLVSRYGIDELGEIYARNLHSLIAILIGCMCFIILFVVIMERHFIYPIVKLSSVMQTLSDTKQALPEYDRKRNDEIGELYEKFRQMLIKIDELVQDKYVNEIHLLKERLNGLMSQINSHFLFNTLENINCLADMDGNQRVAQMSKSLGDMLHYSIEYEQVEETLHSEIENIRDYVKIQEIRFDNKIMIIEEIPNELQKCRVLKFILQPLVENAIEHGLIEESKSWWIKLRAEAVQSELHVSVENAGKQLSEEELLAIRSNILNDTVKQLPNMEETGRRRRSIGLSNIQRRIQLMYSPEYGIEALAGDDGGLKVVIRLPLKTG